MTKPICCICKKPVKGKVHYQANMKQFPVHKKCKVSVKRSKDGGI